MEVVNRKIRSKENNKNNMYEKSDDLAPSIQITSNIFCGIIHIWDNLQVGLSLPFLIDVTWGHINRLFIHILSDPFSMMIDITSKTDCICNFSGISSQIVLFSSNFSEIGIWEK